jgi:hypothetical protein
VLDQLVDGKVIDMNGKKIGKYGTQFRIASFHFYGMPLSLHACQSPGCTMTITWNNIKISGNAFSVASSQFLFEVHIYG